jgi:cyclopropane fatty-acyl-phospholipid synthase-like methyltransferase
MCLQNTNNCMDAAPLFCCYRWSMDDMVTAFVALHTVQRTNSQQQATPTAEGAAAAAQAQAGLQSISHVLDLGCGIGSVLLMVAWGLRRMAMGQQHQQQHQEQQFAITSLGVEAQSISYQLAVRNIKYNLGADQQQVQVSLGWLSVGEGGRGGTSTCLLTARLF